jgi:ketosteroid isomerase-like protein
MSEKNKAVLVQANACVSRGDHEGFMSFCTDDTQWTFVGDQTLQGKEEPPVFNVENMIAEGEYVTMIGKISLKNEGGKIIDYAYCDVWRFQEDKMAELKAFVIEILNQQTL